MAIGPLARTALQSGGHFLRNRPDRLACGAMSWDPCSCTQQSDQIFNLFTLPTAGDAVI